MEGGASQGLRVGSEKLGYVGEGPGGVAEKSIKENLKVLTPDEGGGDLGPRGHFRVHSREMMCS